MPGLIANSMPNDGDSTVARVWAEIPVYHWKTVHFWQHWNQAQASIQNSLQWQK